MRRRSIVASLTAGGVVLAAAAAGAALAPAANAAGQKHRYLVVARSADDLPGVKRLASSAGAEVVPGPGSTVLAVQATPAEAATLDSSALTTTVVRDRRVSLVEPEAVATSKPTRFDRRPGHGGPARPAAQDPAYALPGLMWNLDRIRSPKANATTYGSPSVTVAVADTGLDFTHSELAGKISGQYDSVSGTPDEVCKNDFGADDADLAAEFGGPANTDWNGHGTWIGGNIAGALDKVGMNGIASKVKLFDLKIANWCGSTWDSSILAAFEYAAAKRFDVVSISFGGYLDRSDPEQDAIYQAYVQAVAKARAAGTLIVAAAGNEHTRIGPGGLVLSHGSLNIPGEDLADYYGTYETPGGIPGVVMVSATGNVVAPPSASCPAGTADSSIATCKPASDAHQATGIGRKDQLTYYSNYGPRIDIAAPGGARKFNVPAADRGGTPGWPVTDADGYTAFEEFSITSNWAAEIACYTLQGPFYADQCYSTIQGTSMATPHVSAVAALVASAKPWLRHRPAVIVAVLKATARDGDNTTPPLSATDTSPMDLTGVACTTGYCHLGGRAISDREAYGAGILDAAAAVR